MCNGKMSKINSYLPMNGVPSGRPGPGPALPLRPPRPLQVVGVWNSHLLNNRRGPGAPRKNPVAVAVAASSRSCLEMEGKKERCSC